MNTPKKVSAPIRMSPELMGKVATASDLTGLSQADILRLALAIGLEDLRRINYDIAGSIVSAAKPLTAHAPPLAIAAKKAPKLLPDAPKPKQSRKAN